MERTEKHHFLMNFRMGETSLSRLFIFDERNTSRVTISITKREVACYSLIHLADEFRYKK
ncbi:hypothetical protein ACMD2_11478 [Ananas comosus]|uniref:Uncharacterized protein n=1 Tax=Ananas comosus TaxID=4615 RepID=A0A199VVM0_ANACO|nr:hypothetical protein ACMD2_11478 [Ananas comosus]